jgi:predicted enzyme related to lactoylglutathione lyase
MNVRFVHTNLVANDWKRLADFYECVFGCQRVPPERDLRGQWLEDATGVSGAEIRGIHLRLPGYGEEGPTLEVFQYKPEMNSTKKAANSPGFAHIAFAVDDVEKIRDAVIDAGGGTVGKVVSLKIGGAGDIIFAYVTDPEGNIIELQRWS